MIKRLLLLLCLTLTAGSAAWADIAQGTFKNGGSWKITDQGELYIDATTVPNYDVNLFGVNNNVGYARDNKMIFVRGITKAPWGAYSSKITIIKFSSKLQHIGDGAFFGMTGLKNVTIDGNAADGITIDYSAFEDCIFLKEFDFQHVTEIDYSAFAKTAFATVTLPVIQEMDLDAFKNCYNLFRDASKSPGGIHITSNAVPTFNGFWSVDDTKKWWSIPGNCYYTEKYVQTGHCLKIIVPPSMYASYSQKHFENQLFKYGHGMYIVPGDNGWDIYDGTLVIDINHGIGDYTDASNTPWYSLRNSIKRIEISNAVQAKIGNNAFNGCTQLEAVLGRGVKQIIEVGENAFTDCISLSFFLPENVKKIGKEAFSGCLSYKYTDISSAQEIGDFAFDGVPFTSISFGHSISSIGQYAFRGSFVNGGDIYCYSKVPTTHSTAFSGANAAKTTLHVTGDVLSGYLATAPWNTFQWDQSLAFPVSESDYYCSWTLTRDGTLTVSGGQSPRMKNYTKPGEQPWYLYRDYIKKIVFTSTVSHIGDYAFAFGTEGESRVTEIEIPTAYHIGNHAFENNDKLRSVSANRMHYICDYAFAGCSNIERYQFGNDLMSIGDHAFDGCENVDVLALTAANPPEVTAETFVGLGSNGSGSSGRRRAGATGQKGVTLDVPEEYMTKYMANIYWRLFAFYTGEHGNVVKSGKYYDGAWVIYSDGTLIASSNTSEGDIEGFFNQPSVKRVQFLGGATKLTWAGFGGHNLPNVEEIVLSPALTVLGDEAFKDLTKLKSINLENVLSIGRETFKGCTSLTAANLQTVEQIGDNAFEGCKGLTDVTLYGKGGKIGYYAFQGCTSLKSIDMSGINYAATGVFEGCSSLESVIFRGQALQIYSNMFKNCSALRSIDVCDDCWSIGSSSLAGTSISRIYSASPKPPVINETAFGDRSLNSITAYVPADYMNAYRKAPVWRNMNFAIDERYGEPQLPTGGLVGEKGIWNLDETGTLTIDCNGAMPQFDELGASTWSWNRTFDRRAGFIENVRYTDRLTSIAQDVTDNEAELGTYGSVQTVEIGTNVESIGANAMRYTDLTDVYCFAPEPPVIVTSEENGTFDMAALKAKGTTLHVVDFQGTLDKYRNSYRWNWFPNIVADLPTRKPGTIMVERVNVTSATGTRLTVDRSQLGKTTVQLEADVYPANADNTAVVWTSEDESVATVDENGLVTIKDYPEMMEVGITATAADGSNRKGTVSLYISNPDNDWGSVLCTGMEADRKTITIMKSQTPVTLTVRLTPANSTANIDFDVENFNMVQVDAEYDDRTGRRTGVFRISAPDPMMVPEIMTGSTTLHFYTHYYDEAACNYVQPEVYVNVNIIEDVIFTEENAQDVPVTYAVTTLDGNICTVYGKWVDGHEEDGIFIDSYYDTAIDKDTKGLVTVPAKARNYYVTGVGAGAFTGCSQLEEVEFEQGIRFIGSQAFDGCSSLSEVLLPASIESFGWGCFMGLPNLKDVHILATTPPTGQGVYNGNNYFPAITDSNAFAGLTSATLHVPAGCRAAYDVYPWNYWFSTITEDAIDGIELIDNGQLTIDNDWSWYSLDGRKLNGMPTKAGIYINGGKKVVIK